MTIRIAKNADVHLIAKVAKTTWNATYREMLSQQFIDDFLEKAYSIDRLTMRFEKSLVYVVEEFDKIVGFINLSKGVDATFELVALYVLPNYQGKGCGKGLLEHCIRDQQNLKQVVLHVEQENIYAMNFYSRNGFEVIERYEEFFLCETLRTVKMQRNM